MYIDRRSVLVIIGSLLVCAASSCGMRSSLDEGNSKKEITVASGMDSGTNRTAEEQSYCGDGRLDLQRGEQCDGTNLGYMTCETLGHGIGTLKCSSGCYFDVSLCVPPPTTIETPPNIGRTTPVGNDDNNAYGSNPFSNIINAWLDRTRDADADGDRRTDDRDTRD